MPNYKLRPLKEMGEIVNVDKLGGGDAEVFVIIEEEGQSETPSEEVGPRGANRENSQ